MAERTQTAMKERVGVTIENPEKYFHFRTFIIDFEFTN